MKKLTACLMALVMLSTLLAAGCFAETAAADNVTTKLNAHFAAVEEGQQLMRERTLFHAQITEGSLDFFLQRKGGTLEDYIE